MKKSVTLSDKEQSRVRILDEIRDWVLTEIQWAELMNLSTRQTRRLLRRYDKQGIAWLVHKARWRPGKISLDKQRIQKIVALPLFSWFKPSYMSEKLESRYWIHICKESMRKLMIQWWLWEAHIKKDIIYRMQRTRLSQYGMMIQFDGSYHDWLENGQDWCLLVSIDDATGKLMQVELCENEWYICVARFRMKYILLHGVPESIYTDKFSTYKSNHPKAVYEKEMKTQFSRAMQELWCRVILANSPQAKGRVERANETLQDRLIKDMRLAGIKDIEGGNRYIREVYIPEHNRRYSIPARQEGNKHDKINEIKRKELIWIFSRRSVRVIGNDMCVQYKSRFLQLLAWEYEIRPKKQVEIWESIEGKLRIVAWKSIVEWEEIEYHIVVSERARKWNTIRKENEKLQKGRLEAKKLDRFFASKQKQAHYKAQKLLQKPLL